MKKFISVFVAVLLFVSLFGVTASAKSVVYAPYEGYEYNDYEESVAAPIGYLQRSLYDGNTMKLDIPLKNPSDLVCGPDGKMYILDSGNGRIIQCNADFSVQKIYDRFVTEAGEEKDITGAQGMTLNADGTCFYIANTEKLEVLKVKRDGTVINVITRPEDVVLNTEANFAATKVVVDKKDQLYVLVSSINVGAFVYDANGEFLRFFGSNPIVTTAEVIRDYFWKKFMTKEQRKGLTRVTPTAFSNFDVDAYGFLYTVSSEHDTTAQAGTVRRLNYSGNDILSEGIIFGDLERDRGWADESKYTSFTDIDIDSDGYINLLDIGRGRIFQYTTDGQMITAFGSYSEGNATFKNPVALETVGSTIYVLDSARACVLRFEPTEYVNALRNAFSMLSSTDTQAAKEAWTNVLRMNTNSQYAYYGIGMALDQEGDYAAAMEQFKLAGAHEEYSKSLREYRKDFISDYYWLIILVFAAIIAAVVVIIRLIKKKSALVHGTAYSSLESRYMFPIYTAMHPADGFEQFRHRPQIMSVGLSVGIAVAWFFISTFSYFCTGYSFNYNRAIDYQFFMTLFMTVGLFVLFVVSNWSVCSLTNGKGTVKMIITTTAYALVPYLVSQLLKVAMSNVLTIEESAFIGIVSGIGLLWSALILFVGLSEIHQYSVRETIGSILLTIVFMAIICFIAVLFYTLLQQLINFIRSAIAELQLR